MVREECTVWRTGDGGHCVTRSRVQSSLEGERNRETGQWTDMFRSIEMNIHRYKVFRISPKLGFKSSTFCPVTPYSLMFKTGTSHEVIEKTSSGVYEEKKTQDRCQFIENKSNDQLDSYRPKKSLK